MRKLATPTATRTQIQDRPDGKSSDSAALPRTASIVRDRSNVFDTLDPETKVPEGSNGGFTPYPRSPHIHVHLMQSGVDGLPRCGLRRSLSGVGCRFLRTTKAKPTGACPRYRIAVQIRDRYHGVVEGGLYIDVALVNRLLFFLLITLDLRQLAYLPQHCVAGIIRPFSYLQRSSSSLCASGRSFSCVALGRASLSCDGDHDNIQYPSAA